MPGHLTNYHPRYRAGGTGKKVAEVAEVSGGQTRLVAKMVEYQKRSDRFSPADFTLNPDNSLTCPGGFTSHQAYTSPHGNGLTFRFPATSCASCPLLLPCRGAQVAPSRYRQVFISNYRRSYFEALAYSRTEPFKADMKLSPTIEPLIADLVNHHDGRHAPARGLLKADFHVKMCGMALNTTRFIARLQGKEVNEAQSPQELVFLSMKNGRQTANGRSNTRFKELPGGSPAMLPWLLNRSIFLSLQDMGFPLPAYSEIPVSVEMAPEQAVLYEALKAQLKEELKERLIHGDKSLLSAYLYALLFWPDSPRRGKVVTCPRTGQEVAAIPGLPAEFRGPKEERIIQLCRQEKTAGRKVLLFCQQTDTLDITQEWKGMLEAAGLKTAVLRADPSKREAWVEKQVAAGIDVLITHPKKVQTGLDLLQFPTLIWMSIDYSVYTVLQASHRSWRIGQTEPVKVYFFSYEETIQEDALRLVAAKVAAALRVNGDTVGDDTLAELDSLTAGDLIATLAKIVTGEAKLETKSLQQAFAEANASLKQANTVIGEYTMIENGTPETLTHSEAQQVMEAAVAEETNPAQTLTLGLLDALERVKRAVIGDENGQVGRQPSLFTNGNGRKPNGNGRSHPHENGHTVNKSLLSTTQPANGKSHPPNDTPLVSTDKSTPPPVPRPRLLTSLLRVG